MSEQSNNASRPLNSSSAPDPSRSYERSRPEDEAGMGRMDNNDDATPTLCPEHCDDAVQNRSGKRQINAEDVIDQLASSSPDESRSKATPNATAHATHQSHLHGNCGSV